MHQNFIGNIIWKLFSVSDKNEAKTSFHVLHLCVSPTCAEQVTSDLYLSKSDLISSGPYNHVLGGGGEQGGLVMAEKRCPTCSSNQTTCNLHSKDST